MLKFSLPQVMEVMDNDKVSRENLSSGSVSIIPREANRFGKRHVLLILGLLGFTNVYALRVNLSVALVAMVNSTYTNENSQTNSQECSHDGPTSDQVVNWFISGM